jgi:hypothetical protein
MESLALNRKATPMRRVLLPLMLCCAALAAACGGPPATATPTPTRIVATETPPLPEVTAEVTQPLTALQTVVLPAPGELTYLNTEGTPPAPRQPLQFDHVQLEIRDGSGAIILIDVFADGRIVRDGAERTLSVEALDALRSALDIINFYEIEGVYTANAPGSTRYALTVEGPRGSRTLLADDSATPRELLDVFTLIMDL